MSVSECGPVAGPCESDKELHLSVSGCGPVAGPCESDKELHLSTPHSDNIKYHCCISAQLHATIVLVITSFYFNIFILLFDTPSFKLRIIYIYNPSLSYFALDSFLQLLPRIPFYLPFQLALSLGCICPKQRTGSACSHLLSV